MLLLLSSSLSCHYLMENDFLFIVILLNVNHWIDLSDLIISKNSLESLQCLFVGYFIVMSYNFTAHLLFLCFVFKVNLFLVTSMDSLYTSSLVNVSFMRANTNSNSRSMPINLLCSAIFISIISSLCSISSLDFQILRAASRNSSFLIFFSNSILLSSVSDMVFLRGC